MATDEEIEVFSKELDVLDKLSAEGKLKNGEYARRALKLLFGIGLNIKVDIAGKTFDAIKDSDAISKEITKML